MIFKGGHIILTVKNVEKKKMIVALTIAIMAIGTLLLISPALAEEDLGEPEATGKTRSWRPLLKLRLLIYVLKNGTPTELGGEVVVLDGRILVLSIDDSLTNVNIPGKWIVDGETMTAQELFDGDPIGPGDAITINSLKIEVVRETHKVKSYFAYRIEAEETTASVVLPFNIEG
jgi:hypothetical protein